MKIRSLLILTAAATPLLWQCGRKTVLPVQAPAVQAPAVQAPAVRPPAVQRAVSAPCRSGVVRTEGKVTGDGSSFASPLYAQWLSQNPSAQVTYNSFPSGSQKGIELFCEGKTDFAATDWPLAPSETGELVLQIPVALGAVVPIYNVPGAHGRTIHFSRETLARIFGPENRGIKRIQFWDDDAIQKDQEAGGIPSGIALPHQKIKIVHRSDGSGTTFVFLQFLHGSPQWTGPPPQFETVEWPSPNTSAKGSTALAREVSDPSSGGEIGYVEYYYPLGSDEVGLPSKLDYGCILNDARNDCVEAGIPSIGAAICTDMPTSLKGLMTVDLREMQRCTVDSSNANAYRISAFTFILVPAHVPDDSRRESLQKFLRWMLDAGQSVGSGVGYAPLPHELAALALEVVDQIKP